MTSIAPPPYDPPRDAPLDEAARAALFAGIAALTVARPASPLDRLRDLPTAARVAISATLVLAVGLAGAFATGLRPDVSAVAAPSAFVALAGVAASALALRPAGRPLSAPWRVGLALAALAPLGTLLLPPEGVVLTEVHGALHMACGASAWTVAAVVAAAFAAFDRGAPGRAWRALGVGGAAGAAGFLTATLHCPVANLTHVILAHTSAGLVTAGVLAALSHRAPLGHSASGSSS